MTPDRRGLTHRWTVPQATSGSDLPLIDRVLDARGYSDPQARAAFLKGSLMDLPEPDTLPGCTQAAGLVLQAIKNNTPITIYGDFDVDGVTATAMLLHLIRTMAPQADVDWHIPHRIDEGYGLNADALTTIAATRKGLVITVDCGVTAIEEAALAAELGLTLIITDHHTIGPDDPLPQAAAIVHPGLPNDPYPFRDLAGAGVAWKLALCMAQQFVGGPTLTQDLRQVILDGLTLAAFGTVADVMPLHGENRHIVTVGLRHVSQCSLPGVHALVQACTKPGEKVAAETVGFRIGPRLNAAGRLGHARDALEVLLTKDEDQARTIAEALAACNVKRQDMVRTLVAVAQDQATANGMTSPDTRMIVLAGDDDIWHRGVLGITCSRLAEQFRRPTILLRRPLSASP